MDALTLTLPLTQAEMDALTLTLPLTQAEMDAAFEQLLGAEEHAGLVDRHMVRARVRVRVRVRVP